MRVLLVFISSIALLACSKRTEYLIQVPLETHITSESILTELENGATSDPDNERLIKQQLYFCEQLGWPARCEQVLIKAKSRWGLTEKLLDQSIAYYQKYEDYERVARLLNGAFETRGRLETKIEIASTQSPGDNTFLDRYLDQYKDGHAHSFAANIFLDQGDTSSASSQFDLLLQKEPSHRDLLKYYPILETNNNLHQAIQIIEYQLVKRNYSPTLALDLAENYYKIDSLKKAKKILKTLNNERGNLTLIGWFKERQEWDSALFYINEMIAGSPENRSAILSKAEVFESKGWFTPSLPYYEQAFALDTTDLELAEHIQIVRRKVASLRRKKEQESRLQPPSLERKTGN